MKNNQKAALLERQKPIDSIRKNFESGFNKEIPKIGTRDLTIRDLLLKNNNYKPLNGSI